MDTARYAELFLTESQDNLSAINHALLELERTPDSAGAGRRVVPRRSHREGHERDDGVRRRRGVVPRARDAARSRTAWRAPGRARRSWTRCSPRPTCSSARSSCRWRGARMSSMRRRRSPRFARRQRHRVTAPRRPPRWPSRRREAGQRRTSGRRPRRSRSWSRRCRTRRCRAFVRTSCSSARKKLGTVVHAAPAAGDVRQPTRSMAA